MASNGTLSVEVNLKSVANEFWNCIKDSTTIIFPKRGSIQRSVLKYYKSFKGHIVVNPKADGNGSLVKWSSEFEKPSEEIMRIIVYQSIDQPNSVI
uniref:Bet v I/Major latex protein domain-containing protein n=1 Tax=Cucumis sativus TaxID=3659 RepID=A0A0A0KVP3_CUCSA